MNDHLTTEDEKNFIRSTYAIRQIDKGSESTTLSSNSDHIKAKSIVIIENLVHDILKCDDNIFYISINKLGKYIDCKDKSIFNRIQRHTYYGNCKIEDIDVSFSIHKYSPHVQLFIRTFTNLNIYVMDLKEFYSCQVDNNPEESDKKLQAMVDVLNNFIDSIKSEAGSQQFKTELYEHKRLINDNYKSLLKYINKLFVRYSRLLVLRIDLGYRMDVDNPFLDREEIYAKYSQAKKDREHLFNNMRSNRTIFKNVVGYAWKLEFASYKGFHYHFLFFLDSSKAQQDISRAMMIGKYWAKVITKGNGLYYNCNAHKDDYKYCGIGVINHYDTELMENLKNKVAPYLTKTDYYAKINAKDIDRTFGKGEITKPKDKRGRPRKNANVEQSLPLLVQ